MSNRQWRRFRKAQLKSVQPTDATRGIEKAVHKEMHTRLRDAERLAKKLAKDNLVRARRDLRKALTSKTPISDQELRRLMTRVKMLEPDSYGVRETVKGVTQLQQPLQRLAELKVIEQRLKAKQAQGGKLDKAEAAELARVEAELGTVRKKVAAALSRRAGRSTTSAHMHALAEEAIENAAMLWIHTAWRGNSFGGVKSAAKYHERVRHAYEAMGFKAVTGGPTDASFELMVKKMTGDLDAASADKALREWAVARDPKWAKASDQAIRDMFVRETRVHANQLSKQMHTRALSRDIANPDAANPPTIQGPKPAPKDGPDTGGAGGAAATGGHKPPPLNGLDNPHALDAPLDRTKPVGTTGYKGSLATRPGFGVFEGTLNGKPVLVKVYKDWGPMRGQMLREMEGARAAELTGYGPKVYGVVDVGTNPKKGVGFAMDRQPGGFIDAGAKTPETLAEAAQVRARVNEKTIAQMRDYGKKLVENGYVNKGELQFLVDKNGNLKPIDFQGVEKLSDDPTERARQLAGHRDSIDGGVSELETAMKKAKSGGGS